MVHSLLRRLPMSNQYRKGRRRRALRRLALLGRFAPALLLGLSTDGEAASEWDEDSGLDASPRQRSGSAADENGRLDTRNGVRDLGSQLGVLGRGLLMPPTQTTQAAPFGARSAQFRWRAPHSGAFRLDFFPVSEPPFQYSLAIDGLASGTQRTLAKSTVLALELTSGQELRLEVAALEANADNRYELSIEAVDSL
jgi:hypothetical protein